jgi:hypothetical protein
MTTTALVQRDAAPSTSLALMDTKNLEAQLALLEDPKRLELLQRLAGAYDKACAALIGEGDVQREGTGTNARVFKKKSAWRKLGRYFGISTRILTESIEQLPDGEFIARCVVRGSSPWGQEIDATGACGSDEESGRRTITMADAIATAQTRAANRAVSDLVAMGEVSAEEIGEGRAAKANGKKRDARPELTLEEALEIEYPWENPKKYAGKPLRDVSTNMLMTIGEWGKKKIDAGDASESVARMYRATVLILETRDDLDAVIAEREKKKGADDANTAAATTVDSDGAPAAAPAATAPAAESAPAAADPAPAPTLQLVQDGPAPAAEEQPAAPATDTNGQPWGFEAGPLVDEEEAAPEPTLAELSAQLIPLLDDPKTPADVREQILAKASSGGMRTVGDYKQAIGKLTLLHTIGA